MSSSTVILCPGQGAQAVGMGRGWFDSSDSAKKVFSEADSILSDQFEKPLSDICFNGPTELLNQTNVSQPAIYVTSVACFHALAERNGELTITSAAGLSLGEYTALYLAGSLGYVEGLKLVAARGRFMQDAAETSKGSMLAIIGASEEQAKCVCNEAAGDDILVCANFNSPGQIVISGHAVACQRAEEVASRMELRATQLAVAGAFHSPLMQPAADRMADLLSQTEIKIPEFPVWSNVTALPHETDKPDLLKQRLIEQIVNPVRWHQSCEALTSQVEGTFVELAPGTVLRGLMRRINRNTKVESHDQP